MPVLEKWKSFYRKVKRKILDFHFFTGMPNRRFSINSHRTGILFLLFHQFGGLMVGFFQRFRRLTSRNSVQPKPGNPESGGRSFLFRCAVLSLPLSTADRKETQRKTRLSPHSHTNRKLWIREPVGGWCGSHRRFSLSEPFWKHSHL